MKNKILINIYVTHSMKAQHFRSEAVPMEAQCTGVEGTIMTVF